MKQAAGLFIIMYFLGSNAYAVCRLSSGAKQGIKALPELEQVFLKNEAKNIVLSRRVKFFVNVKANIFFKSRSKKI